MVRTKNKTETINFLQKVSKRTAKTTDNHYFINQDGKIVGHGYLQGNGDYFSHIPEGSIDIVVQKGTTKKIIRNEVKRAMSGDDGHGCYCEA